MSERPDNPQNQEPPQQGGWHSPGETSPWQEPETQAASSVAWREIKALPDDVDREPEQRGMWHLPDENDTIFAQDDVVEISDEPRDIPTTSSVQAVRPEDLIAEILSGTQKQAAVPNPEDFDYSSTRQRDEDETSAGDAIEEGDTLLVDEDPFEDEEAFSISEYVALANLAQGDDDDLAGMRAGDLSPAEQAAYNTALNVQNEMDSKPTLDPDLEPDIPADATVTMDDTASQPAGQAADYARRALEELAQQQGDQGDAEPEPAGGFSQPAQPQEQQYSQEEVELAQQFRETQRQVGVLRQMEQQGQIDPQELQVRLQQHSILDPRDGTWWMIGYETNEWYRYDNQSGQWVASAPPVPLDAGQARTETGLGEAAPDVMPGSLPYLPQDSGTSSPLEYSDQDVQYDNTQYDTAQANYTNQYPVDSGMVQNPNQPQYDPNLTQVGNSFDATQIGTDPTYQNMRQVDPNATYQNDAYSGQQTVQSSPFDSGQTMQSGANLGDLVYDDYAQQPQQQTYPDDGFQDYNASAQNVATPTADQIEGQNRNQALAFLGIAAFVIVIFGLILVGGSAFIAMNQYTAIVEEWRSEIDALGTADFDFQTATIRAADGTTIAELTSELGARTVVNIDNGEVSPFFVHAIVSSEDPRFYENPGFDVIAIGRAFLQNFLGGEVTSGASTITQQIVRDRVLGSNVVSFDRKLTEALLSMEVARTYSKTDILNIYINEFFYGQQSYGVEAAADFYFDTTASELDAAQSALLAGLLPSPSDSNPVVAPLVSFNNMEVILERMVETECLNFQHGEWERQGVPFCINEDTLVNDGDRQVPLFRRDSNGDLGGFLRLQIAQVETRRYQPRQSDIQYPHFVFYVLGELDRAFGGGAYIERGFTVDTTLVPRIQNAAESALQQGVNAFGLQGVQTGAALVTDPRNGAILAMVGSPDFNDEEIDGQNNNTISLQQPGSAIKPVVYATALTGTQGAGYFTPASILWDVPTIYTVGSDSYEPVNFDGQFRGPVSVRNALAQSLNIPAVKTYAQFGTQAFIETANRMGINFDPYEDDDLTPTFGLPTAVGATEVTLMDLTQAYATIANDGIRTEMIAVTNITERTSAGNEQVVELIENLNPEQQVQAISPQVAYLLQNIMSDENARTAQVNGVGSTFPPNSNLSGVTYGLNNQNQIAVKTGTNNTSSNGNPSRVWTMGFTNNYAVGVWLGSLNQATPLTGGPTGFSVASPVWRAVMTEALNGQNPGSFDNPGGVVQNTVCQLTGTLSPQGSNCPNRITEIYVQGQPPPPPEQGFVTTINIDSWTGLRSNQWCPDNVVSETFANISDPFAVNWLNSSGRGRQILSLLNLPQNLQAPPQGECQQGQVLPTVLINFPQEGASLQGTVAITGQVSAQGLQRWELQVAPVGTDNFNSIMPQPSTSQVQQGGSILFEWDTTSAGNGPYILRLAAFSNDGGFIFRDVQVQLTNPEPTPIPPTPTPFVIEITPLPFEEPTSSP